MGQAQLGNSWVFFVVSRVDGTQQDDREKSYNIPIWVRKAHLETIMLLNMISVSGVGYFPMSCWAGSRSVDETTYMMQAMDIAADCVPE